MTTHVTPEAAHDDPFTRVQAHLDAVDKVTTGPPTDDLPAGDGLDDAQRKLLARRLAQLTDKVVCQVGPASYLAFVADFDGACGALAEQATGS